VIVTKHSRRTWSNEWKLTGSLPTVMTNNKAIDVEQIVAEYQVDDDDDDSKGKEEEQQRLWTSDKQLSLRSRRSRPPPAPFAFQASKVAGLAKTRETMSAISNYMAACCSPHNTPTPQTKQKLIL
jgi:hypothetical protein